MSWSVNGKMYHNRAEYQRALATHNTNRARGEASALRGQLQKSQGRVDKLNRELQGTRGDIQAQRRITDQLQQEVQKQDRLHKEAAASRARIEQEMRAGLAEAHAHYEATNERVESLETHVEESMREVNQEFENVRNEIAQNAKQLRQEQEQVRQELQQNINAVDQELKQEIQKKVDQQNSDLDKAQIYYNEVSSFLNSFSEDEANRLDLESKKKSLKTKQENLEQIIRSGGSQAANASAAARNNWTDYRELQEEIHTRESKLQAAQNRLTFSAEEVEATISDENIQKFYGKEAQLLQIASDKMKKKAAENYNRFDYLAHREDSDAQKILELEKELTVIQQNANWVPQLLAERAEMANDTIKKVIEARGEPDNDLRNSSRLVDPSNPKSNLECRLEYGNQFFTLTFPPEHGSILVNGGVIGNPGNAECEAAAKRQIEVLEEVIGITQTDMGPQELAHPPQEQSQVNINESLGNLQKLSS